MKKIYILLFISLGFIVSSYAQAPVANFTGTPTTICAGQSVVFTNTSTGLGNTYAWTFPGGTPGTSALVNPTVIYNTAGVYNVTLVATNFSGTNTLLKPNYITVLALPTISISPSSASICTGGSVSLTASGASTYSWSPGTGLSATTGATVTASPTTTTTYTVTGTAASGCTNTATVTVSVSAGPPATPGFITGLTSVCSGQAGVTYSIVAVATATSYNWTVPAGATITAGA